MRECINVICADLIRSCGFPGDVGLKVFGESLGPPGTSGMGRLVVMGRGTRGSTSPGSGDSRRWVRGRLGRVLSQALHPVEEEAGRVDGIGRGVRGGRVGPLRLRGRR